MSIHGRARKQVFDHMPSGLLMLHGGPAPNQFARSP